jgi:predicted dehydrogenase
MINERLSRRHFFYGALLTGAIPAGGFGSTPSLRFLGFKSPNEKLNIAAIGAGGRAEQNLQGVESENLVAFADPDSKRAANMFSWYEKAPKYTDFRKMLDKEEKNIDAVVITTPDHLHAIAAISCMERGKHVYVEKPLTHTVAEARYLAQAAAKYKVATQMGNQGYSNNGTRIAAEIIWSGEIGNVTEVHAWTNRPVWPQGIDKLPAEEKVPDTLDWDMWLGPAKQRPFSSDYLPFNWRAWFDFGCGALGDIACHVLGAPNIALMLGAPTSVEAVWQEGKNPYTFPKRARIVFEFPARGSMPPVKIFWYDGVQEDRVYKPAGISDSEPLFAGPGSFGAGGGMDYGTPSKKAAGSKPAAPPPAQKPGTRNPMFDPGGAVFVGDKGFLTADNYAANIRLLPESRHNDYKLPPQFLTRSPGHYRDWLRACKGGDPACSNFSVAAPFSEWILLGSLSLHFEGKLQWDSVKMKITNNAKANELLTTTYRKGWDLPKL